MIKHGIFIEFWESTILDNAKTRMDWFYGHQGVHFDQFDHFDRPPCPSHHWGMYTL